MPSLETPAAALAALQLQQCQHHLDVLQRFMYCVVHHLQHDMLNMPSEDEPVQYHAWVRTFVGHVQTICEQLAQISQQREAVVASIARAQPLEVRVVIRDAVAQYRQAHPALAVHESYTAGPLLVSGDAYLLYTCITELLNNAADAIAARGRPGIITVAVDTVAETLRLVLQDNGCGMDLTQPGMAQTIFMPFFTTKNSNHTVSLHTGMGLYLVNEIVTAHRGCITVASTAGEGFTVTIMLPLAPPPHNTDAPRPPSPSA